MKFRNHTKHSISHDDKMYGENNESQGKFHREMLGYSIVAIRLIDTKCL